MQMYTYIITNDGSIFRSIKQLLYAHFTYDMVVDASTAKACLTYLAFSD